MSYRRHSFATYHFSGSVKCALYYDNLSDTSGQDIPIARKRTAFIMASSSKDPFWHAGLKIDHWLSRNQSRLPATMTLTCTGNHGPANDSVTYNSCSRRQLDVQQQKITSKLGEQ